MSQTSQSPPTTPTTTTATTATTTTQAPPSPPFPLPHHLASLVYSFDATYREHMNLVLLELLLLSVQYDTPFEVLARLRRAVALMEWHDVGGVFVLTVWPR